MNTGASKQRYRAGDLEIDPLQGCLMRGDGVRHLRPKTLQVLLYLIEQRQRLVTKEELMERLWAGTAVTDDALVQCIVDIRKALGDDSHHPRFIKTFPKAGYRFIGPIEELQLEPPSVQASAQAAEVEIEEITTVEIEGYASAQDQLPEKLLPSPATARQPSRRWLGVMAGILIVTVTVGAYLGEKFWTVQPKMAEVTLPQTAGKKPVAVMYFENQSGSRELDWLREGLADMLITNLSRSQKLTVLSRQQLHLLFERIGRRQAERVSLDEALEVARRAQAEAMILGSFASIGQKVRIDARLHDGRNGQLLAAESLVADRAENLLSQVDLLSLKLASHLKAAPSEEGQRLADVMTDNLAAYRDYSLAVGKAQAYHNAEALELLNQAIALDPQFAMAQARVGYIYAVTWGLAERARPSLEKAFQLSHRLTAKDKLYIKAWYAIAHLDYANAIPPLQEIIANYPMEVEAYQRLGHLLRGEERLADAIHVLKQGLVADPEAKDIYNALGGIYSNLGQHSEAVTMMQRYVALAPDEPNAHDSLALIYQWAGQSERAQSAYSRALALKPDFEILIVNLGNLYFQQGRYQAAIKQYERYLKLARSDMEREKGYGCLAWAYLRQGNLDKAAAAARKEMASGQGSSVGNSLLLALRRGEWQRADELKAQLFAASPYTHRGARPPLRYLYYFLGAHALKRGQAAAAITHFQDALKHLPPLGGVELLEDCLANAYLELGQTNEAIAEYERILKINPDYPLAQYHLAQAYERKGEPAQARTAYERFLQIWKDADSEIPEVVAAKQRLAAF